MKARTFLWYLQRPSFYPYMIEELARKFRSPDRRTLEEKREATERCVKESITLDSFLIEKNLKKFGIPNELASYGYEKESENLQGLGARVPFEGLLGSLIVGREYKYILETGVATGWSSLEILAALNISNSDHLLVSTDMPYPTKNFESFVGCVVPDSLKASWRLIKKPDKNGLFDAFSEHKGNFDLMHYDSDKSYWGRMWAYPKMMKKLSKNGVFISDDIGDNLAFFEYCESNNLEYIVIDKDGNGDQFWGVIENNNSVNI